MKQVDEVVQLTKALVKLRKDNAQLRAMNRKALLRGAFFDDFIDEYREVIAQDKFSYSTPKVKLPPAKGQSTTAAVLSSDLHLAEVVSLADANNINVYDSMRAANRLWQHCQHVKRIITEHRSIHNIDKVWLLFLGDMISGSIHPEYLITNDLTDPAAVILCTRLLTIFVNELKSLGLPILIDAVHGNHPRLTVKMPTKKQAHTNLDWVIYEGLLGQYKADKQIEFHIHTSQIGRRRIYKWEFLLEHGIGVKNGGEEAYEDRLRALFDDPVYREATGMTGPAFHQVIIGNMHKPKFLERTIVNGSYIGQNELGQSWRLKPIRAQQLMFGITQDEARTFEYQIDLTNIRSNKATNPMSEYTKYFLEKHGHG